MLTKQRRGFQILQHAAWHCRFGSASTVTRDPDRADVQAAEILHRLLLGGLEYPITSEVTA